VKPPIAEARQGAELLRRLQAGQRAAVESDFGARAVEAVKPPPKDDGQAWLDVGEHRLTPRYLNQHHDARMQPLISPA
jgi:hypothetical protein